MRIGQQTVTGDTKYIFTLPDNVNNLVIFDVHNDSPYNMGISFGHDTGITNCDYYTSPHGILTGIMPPSIDKRTIGGTRWQGNIYVYTETPVGGGGTTVLANAPASSVTIIGYQHGYQPQGQVALSRMQTTANTVDTNVSSASTTSVANDDNPSGTVFIEATQSGNASGSNIAIGNDGSAIFAQFVSNVLTQLFKIAPGATPLIELGAKIALQMADNSGVLGTILKIDSSGNTVLQQHPTNDQFVFKNSSGSTVFQIDDTGHCIIKNDTSFKALDTNGNDQRVFVYDNGNNVVFYMGSSNILRIRDSNDNNISTMQNSNGFILGGSDSLFNISNVLGVDSSGNTFIQSHTTGNNTNFYDKNGVLGAVFDAVNKAFQIVTTAAATNGTTAGTVTYYQPFTGTNFKVLLVYYNGYRNSTAAEQHPTIPVAFSTKAIVISAATPGITPYKTGSALTNSVRTLTALGTGSGGTTTLQNAIPQNAVSFINQSFDALGHGVSQGGTFTDLMLIVGF